MTPQNHWTDYSSCGVRPKRRKAKWITRVSFYPARRWRQMTTAT